MNEITLNWNEYTESAIKTAAEGIVMIENRDKVLPLKTGAHVALFGRMQTHYYKSGTGSGGMVNVHHVTDIREGLNDCSGITLDAELMDIYDKWDAENPIDTGLGWGKEAWSQAEMPVSSELAETLASRNDYAVVIIARTAGEDRDNSAEKGAYYLSDSEEELLKNVTAAFTNVIVLLNVGNIIDMSFVKKYNVKSVLYVWQAGMIGGISVARSSKTTLPTRTSSKIRRKMSTRKTFSLATDISQHSQRTRSSTPSAMVFPIQHSILPILHSCSKMIRSQ